MLACLKVDRITPRLLQLTAKVTVVPAAVSLRVQRGADLTVARVFILAEITRSNWTRGVMNSRLLFLQGLASMLEYRFESQLGFEFGAVLCGNFLKFVFRGFSGYSRSLPSFIG